MEIENAEVDLSSSTSEQKHETEKPRPKPGLFDTRRKKIVLISVSLYWFATECAFSMLAPIFPAEAKAKGSTTLINGLIFASFPFVLFIFSPIVGTVLPYIGIRATLMTGLLIEGSTQILFGFLLELPNGGIFIAGCFLIRMICALGASATMTASLTLLVQNFQENLSSAQSIMQTFLGLGFMAGPTLGGFLYAAGGFKLPFVVIGGVMLLGSIPMFFVVRYDNKEKKTEKMNKAVVWQLIKIPAVFIVTMMIAVYAMGYSFIDVALQGHLLKFHLKPYQIGLMFFIGPAVYSITTPLAGRIADKKDKRVVMVIGGIMYGLGYILLGPAPILQSFIPSALWLNGIVLALIGFGAGPLLVPVLSDMNQSATTYGLRDDFARQSALSGIFTAIYNIGSIAGATLGGILVQNTNFAWASGIFGSYIWLWTAILTVFTLYERWALKARVDNEETKPILPRRAETSL